MPLSYNQTHHNSLKVKTKEKHYTFLPASQEIQICFPNILQFSFMDFITGVQSTKNIAEGYHYYLMPYNSNQISHFKNAEAIGEIPLH